MKRKRIVVSEKLKRKVEPALMQKHARELSRMFELIPEVSAVFAVPKPKIDFQFSGKREGTYYWGTQTIDICPKPSYHSVIDTFIHEFAHHIQNHAGRLTTQWTIYNKEYTPEGGHGWSFYEMLILVVDHFEFIYGHTYDWSKEYDHIQAFHNQMISTDPVPVYRDEKLDAIMNLFQCNEARALEILQGVTK